MRLIGNCERSIELMKNRLRNRVAFGKRLADQGVWKERVGLSRVETDQARLMTLLGPVSFIEMISTGNKRNRRQLHIKWTQ